MINKLSGILKKNEEIIVEEFPESSLVLNARTRETKIISNIESMVLNRFNCGSDPILAFGEIKNYPNISLGMSFKDFSDICKKMISAGFLFDEEVHHSEEGEEKFYYIQSPHTFIVEKNNEGAILMCSENGKILFLNRSGVEIWEYCKTKKSESQIAGFMKSEFEDIPDDGVESDIAELVGSLEKMGFLNVINDL